MQLRAPDADHRESLLELATISRTFFALCRGTSRHISHPDRTDSIALRRSLSRVPHEHEFGPGSAANSHILRAGRAQDHRAVASSRSDMLPVKSLELARSESFSSATVFLLGPTENILRALVARPWHSIQARDSAPAVP